MKHFIKHHKVPNKPEISEKVPKVGEKDNKNKVIQIESKTDD